MIGARLTFGAMAWVALIVWSLVPTRVIPYWRWGYLVIDLRQYVHLGLCAGAFVSVLLASRHSGLRKSGWPPLAVRSVIFMVFMGLSITWSDLGEVDRSCMLFAVALACCPLICGCEFGALRPAVHLSIRVEWTAIGVSVVGAVYSAQSLFDVGLRPVGNDEIDPLFGIVRVHGPLFLASTGYFVLLPALGYTLQRLFESPRSVRYIVSSSLLVVEMLLLGSRGAVVCGGVFLCILGLVHRRLGKKLALPAVLCLCAVVLVAFVFVFRMIRTDRFLYASDDRRSAYERTFDIMAARPLEVNLLGSGYGSIWPWYGMNQNRFYIPDQHITTTRYDTLSYGVVYHSHSVPLMLVAELGIPGTLYYVALWSTLLAVLWKSYRSRRLLIWSASLVASGVGLFLDLMLFANFESAFLWWFWLFALMRLQEASTPVELRHGVSAQRSNCAGRATERKVCAVLLNQRVGTAGSDRRS